MKIPYTKEHGAWVMFGIAFITGTAKAGMITAVGLIVFLSLALFLMAKAPVATLLRRGEKSGLPFIALYIILGSAGCIYSIIRKPDLIFLYGAGVCLIILYFIFGRKSLPVLSEASAMAIMGLVASIAASLNSDVPGQLYLWVMFFVFYFASSFRVRFTMMKYRIISGVYSSLILLLSVIGAYTGRAIFISFLPLFEDLYSSVKGKKEEFKRIGIIETLKSIVFAALIIAIKG